MPRKKRFDPFTCSEEELIDAYVKNLEELANAIKIKDLEGIDQCQFNGRFMYEAFRRRNLMYTETLKTGRN